MNKTGGANKNNYLDALQQACDNLSPYYLHNLDDCMTRTIKAEEGHICLIFFFKYKLYKIFTKCSHLSCHTFILLEKSYEFL